MPLTIETSRAGRNGTIHIIARDGERIRLADKCDTLNPKHRAAMIEKLAALDPTQTRAAR